MLTLGALNRLIPSTAIALLCVGCLDNAPQRARNVDGGEANGAVGPTPHTFTAVMTGTQSTVFTVPPQGTGSMSDTQVSTGTSTGSLVTTFTNSSTATSTAIDNPRDQSEATPTPAVVTCTLARARAIGSRGGTYGLGNAGEKLYAPVVLPDLLAGSSEFWLKDVEISDYALINPGTIQFEFMGSAQPITVGKPMGPFQFRSGNHPTFSAIISSNPGNNEAQQYVMVWYTVEFKTTGSCPSP